MCRRPTFAYEDKLLKSPMCINPSAAVQRGALKEDPIFERENGKRTTYAFLMQHGVNFHYWLDMLQAAGFRNPTFPNSGSPSGISGEVQKPAGQRRRVSWMGITYSVEATDTWQEFDHFMEALFGSALTTRNHCSATPRSARVNRP
jgi:hypothetical protein